MHTSTSFDCIALLTYSINFFTITLHCTTTSAAPLKGLAGVEGGFRRTMEVTMGLLRENKDALLSVLEPFLRDPTVAWSGRSGRAQRVEGAGSSRQGAIFREQENTEVRAMLNTIGGRLEGIYNLRHPHGDRIRKAYVDG